MGEWFGQLAPQNRLSADPAVAFLLLHLTFCNACVLLPLILILYSLQLSPLAT